MATSTNNNQDNTDSKNPVSSAKMGISGFAQQAANLPSDNGKEKVVSKGASTPRVFPQPTRARADVIRMHTGGNTNKTTTRNKLLLPVLVIVLVSLVGFMSYKYIFENVNFVTPIPGLENITNNGSEEPAKGDRFENPINGMYFSNQDAANFKDKKPITVMVNNYIDARPTEGLSQADIVYEAVEEGGITRLMPVFWSRIPERVASVRSARYYNAQLAAAYNSHFVHWGAAHVPACQIAGTCSKDTEPEVDAYAQIVKLGLPNLDGGNYACQDDAPACVFGRDSARRAKGLAIEHTSYVALTKIYDKAKEVRSEESWHKFIPFTNAWKFKDEATMADRGDIGLATGTPITYNFWDTMAGFNVKWEYNKETNDYLRYQGNEKSIDGGNNQEIRAKVIIIRFTKETPVGDGKHHLYQQLIGTGDALIFQDGKVINAKWTRPAAEVLDKYTDLNGNEVEFVRGQIWVQLVKPENKINYQSTPAATTGTN